MKPVLVQRKRRRNWPRTSCWKCCPLHITILSGTIVQILCYSTLAPFPRGEGRREGGKQANMVCCCCYCRCYSRERRKASNYFFVLFFKVLSPIDKYTHAIFSKRKVHKSLMSGFRSIPQPCEKPNTVEIDLHTGMSLQATYHIRTSDLQSASTNTAILSSSRGPIFPTPSSLSVLNLLSTRDLSTTSEKKKGRMQEQSRKSTEGQTRKA